MWKDSRARYAFRRAVLWLGVIVLPYVTLTGCSDNRPARVKVSGKVFIDGELANTGSLRFYSQSGLGRPSAAKIQPDGSFSVFTFEAEDGIPTGVYDVTVTALERIDEERFRHLLPPKYSDRSSSGITKTIDSATDSMTIELTWDGKKPALDRSASRL